MLVKARRCFFKKIGVAVFHICVTRMMGGLGHMKGSRASAVLIVTSRWFSLYKRTIPNSSVWSDARAITTYTPVEPLKMT